ncbi:hypothetical protein PYW08_010218 [Mythimna loreyi]|uniref:Uncharacterized protein n=1 Tax=Mythimna loreyi TaxID=667449 RepID=A0ACC2Q6Z0_9NEOP|nr:hypothetical protein PYW08_010218 [Mythimna loreyi]
MSSEFHCPQLDTDLLIEEVKLRPCLYARDHLRYGDVNYKRNEWEEVTKKLFQNVWSKYDDAERTEKVELVLKRWKNLRACFTREVKRQKDPNWIYGVAYKRRKYMYYNALTFLKSECDGADEDAGHEIDLPEKSDADNTIVTVDTNIEEIPIPDPVPLSKSKPKTNNAGIPSNSDHTKPSPQSDNTKTLSNSDNMKTPSHSDNTKTSSNSDNVPTPSNTNANNQDSTNFALSLVPMLNMIPIDERVEAQIEILSVLQPFLKKCKDGGKRRRDGKRTKMSSRHVYGKRKEHSVSIEIKSEDESEDQQ